MSISFDLTIDDTRDQLARHARASLEAKPSLIGMSREEMAEALIKAGVPERQVKMRISQLWHWLYVRGVSDFADMRNISKDLRAMLAQHFTIARPEVVEEQISQDGTRKWLFRFPPRVPAVRSKSKASIFPKKAAERSAFPHRSAARSPARFAIPARRSWCATSRRKKFWRSF